VATSARQPNRVVQGLAWLAAGILFYLIARPVVAIKFLPSAAGLLHGIPTVHSAVLGPVPTFIHVVAFSLLSSSILGLSGKRLLLLCGAWALTDVVFEILQHSALHAVRGTFDIADVFAAFAGAGWVVMSCNANVEVVT
jgi:hypothetical protein